MLSRCVWSRNIKNGCSIYIYIYDISRLRVKWCTNSFNIQQLYALPTLYLCVLYLSEKNSDLCHLDNKLIGFITEIRSVYSAVGTGPLNKAVYASFLKGYFYPYLIGSYVCRRSRVYCYCWNIPAALSGSFPYYTVKTWGRVCDYFPVSFLDKGPCIKPKTLLGFLACCLSLQHYNTCLFWREHWNENSCCQST